MTMRQLVCGVVSIIGAAICFAEPDFAGKYHCYGYDPYIEKHYAGMIEITPQNTVYSLKMKYDTGETANGTAALYDDDRLAVVFQNVEDPKKIGLERYSYSKDRKSIEGYWVYLGKDKLGKESCERVK